MDQSGRYDHRVSIRPWVGNVQGGAANGNNAINRQYPVAEGGGYFVLEPFPQKVTLTPIPPLDEEHADFQLHE